MGYRPCASTTIMRNTLHVILAATNLFGVAAAAPIYTVDYTSGASAPSSTNSSAASNANSDDGYSCGRGAAAAGILFLVVFLCCCCCCIKKMMCGGCGRGRCGSGHGRCGQRCRTSPAAPVFIRASVVPADGMPVDPSTAKSNDALPVKDGSAMQPLNLTGTVPGDVITDPTPPYTGTDATGQL